MKLFIFEYIDEVSDNYHCEGGFAIIAKDKESAIVAIEGIKNVTVTDKEWSKVETYDLKDDVEPKYWRFPDAGCC